ncbi:MAG: glycosyltransferase family 4 protein [Piscinibacter sp.]
MRVLIHDAASDYAYDADVMSRRGVGGTEASVVRVAEGLSAVCEVAVAQRGRSTHYSPHAGLRYVPLQDPAPFGSAMPDCAVVVRKHRHIVKLHSRFPHARLLLWIHNWQRPETLLLRARLARSTGAIVTVSEAHREATRRLMNHPLARALGGRIPILRIYNPIDESLAPDDTRVDPDKLVFFSNKGVEQVLGTFGRVRRALPDLRLVVAGNSLEEAMLRSRRTARLARQPGVELLGRVPRHELFRHVRESLCVFYPQDAHAETFGLVFAESNALGTPVLAHDFGAAREVLSSPDQLVDARDTRAVVEKLRAWRSGARPKAFLRPEFRASAVVAEWRRLLGAAPP